MRKFFSLLLLSLCLCTLSSLPALARAPSPLVPLESRVYPALEQLGALHLIDSAFLGSRPWTRSECARLIAEATASAERVPISAAARETLLRLQEEFRVDVEELQSAAKGYLKPLRSMSFAAIYREGESATIPGPKVTASQFPLTENNLGRDYREGGNVTLKVSGDARFGPLLIEWRPEFFAAAGKDETHSSLQEGRAALGLGMVELSFGRQSLWWGQGRHGALVLTSNAAPLDMIRITNPSPLPVPLLGPLRFDLFWSRLEEERQIPKPYFAGLRLNFKPHPRFEIGAARTVIFGGEGQPDVRTREFFTILSGKNLTGGEDTSDQLAALDLRLSLPIFRGVDLYGEYGGEDEAGAFISNRAWLAGLYLPEVTSSGRLSLRLEYADLAHIDDNSPMWYRHGIYLDGYTRKGRILGHHAGGGSKDLLVEGEWRFSPRLSARGGVDFEERGSDQPFQEKHTAPFVAVAWTPQDNLSLTTRYAYDQVTHSNFSAAQNRTLQFASFQVETHF